MTQNQRYAINDAERALDKAFIEINNAFEYYKKYLNKLQKQWFENTLSVIDDMSETLIDIADGVVIKGHE